MRKLSTPIPETTLMVNTPSLAGIRRIQPDAAGMDLGAHEIWVCVPDEGDTQIVRLLDTYTADLHAIGDAHQMRRDGKVSNTAVHSIMGIGLDGQRDVLGHWVADGEESANFWLTILSDLQNRGVEDIFIASVDSPTGCSAAIQAVFPKTLVRRCVIP